MRHKRNQVLSIPEYVAAFSLGFITIVLGLSKKTKKRIIRGFKMGNPANTAWPKDTLPIISRILASGVWNFSFFQFHRSFYFPLWVKMQYDPQNRSFIPRSHNILSINQVCRNWVSISFPGKTNEVCIDPAISIMPYFDSYTVEFAIFKNGELIRPHDEIKKVKMRIDKPGELKCIWRGRRINITALQNGVEVKCMGDKNIIFSIRPFNMEGPSFIDRLAMSKNLKYLGGDVKIHLRSNAYLFQLSDYLLGDSLKGLGKLIKTNLKKKHIRLSEKFLRKVETQIRDRRGLANASFFYQKAGHCHFYLEDKENWLPPKELVEGIAPERNKKKEKNKKYESTLIWDKWFPTLAEAKLPTKFSDLFYYAKNHILTLWDYNTITPGSFIYHHFWIRDTALIMHALMLIAGQTPTKPIMLNLKRLVRSNGLFISQKGEWDGNGQALWIISKYVKLFEDREYLRIMRPKIYKMLRWLDQKTKEYKGVLPPGFSAEHLGISDWYLWDNFWSMGGVDSLLYFQDDLPKYDLKELYLRIKKALNGYLANYKYYPAALGRRKDAGMIGSICAVYPLGLRDFSNKKMLNTLKIIRENYFLKGGFFQENIHSGVNPYLTLQTAESFLHLGRISEAFKIFESIFNWASICYTFPEAAHPQTRFGCMGDGFHGWAFAEIIIFIKNLFFLELSQANILLAGIPEDWYEKELELNHFYTPYGSLSIKVRRGILTVRGFNKQCKLKNLYIAVPKKYYKNAKAIDGAELEEEVPENVWSTVRPEKKLIRLAVKKTFIQARLLDQK